MNQQGQGVLVILSFDLCRLWMCLYSEGAGPGCVCQFLPVGPVDAYHQMYM